MTEYVDGHTFQVSPNEVDLDDKSAVQLDPGWYAQWDLDMETGEVVGPYATEAEAARVFQT